MSNVSPGLVEQLITSALLNSAALVVIVGASGVYDSQAPPGNKAPVCLYQYISGGDENTNLRPSEDVKYRIEVGSFVRATSIAGANAIYDALLNSVLPATPGWTVWRVERDSLFSQVEDVLDSVWYRKGAFYRISLDNA